jgi:hypothetical protein
MAIIPRFESAAENCVAFAEEPQDCSISSGNKIFTAAILAEPADACRLLQQSLGIEHCDAMQIDVPSRREWMRAGVGRRLQMLADWLHTAAFVLVDRTETPVEGHYPMDFSLRTND